MPVPSTLEANVARYADRIAYISHDIDDAIRAGVLRPADLPEKTNSVLGRTPSERIDSMVGSLVDESSPTQVRMGSDVFDAMADTRAFMFERVYVRPEMKPEHDRARSLLEALLAHYTAAPESVPDQTPDQMLGSPASSDPETAVVDYVAGMTDRFALREYERLIGVE
jgi:dGTPase